MRAHVGEEDGDFELVEISSPSEAALDYYALTLIATEKGRRTLVVSGERVPLYEEGGLRHITIQVEEGTLSTELRELLDE